MTSRPVREGVKDFVMTVLFSLCNKKLDFGRGGQILSQIAWRHLRTILYNIRVLIKNFNRSVDQMYHVCLFVTWFAVKFELWSQLLFIRKIASHCFCSGHLGSTCVCVQLQYFYSIWSDYILPCGIFFLPRQMFVVSEDQVFWPTIG